MRPGYSWHSSSTRAGPLDRGGAHHHAFDAGVEQLRRRVGRPHAAADLDLAGDAADHEADLVEVRAGAGAGRVEVDHVDPLGAGGLELAGHAHRVVVVDGLRVEVALVQAHAVATPQVDRGIQIGDRRPHGWRRRNGQSVPFVDGTPVPSTLTASRSARATPLNDASITW